VSLVYPTTITVTGNPAQHGTADLALTLDVNCTNDIHVVVTAEQLVALHRDIGHKLTSIPYRLVSEEVSNV